MQDSLARNMSQSYITNFPNVQDGLIWVCEQCEPFGEWVKNQFKSRRNPASLPGTKRKCHSNKGFWQDCLDLMFLSCPFLTSVLWACGSLGIIFRVTLKVNELETGKCWGSGAMLDIFGPYSSTGRRASDLPSQLLSPPVLSFSLSLSVVVFSVFSSMVLLMASGGLPGL